MAEQKNRNILIIGAGNMGSAFARGILARMPKAHIGVCDKDQAKFSDFKTVPVSETADPFLAEAEVVILAIKPQSFLGFCGELASSLSGKLVVSVMAGVSIKSIQEKSGASRVIRSMPNLPAKVGRGLVGWCASPEVDEAERRWVQSLFSALGESVQVEDEARIDAVTALSGSGPAYFFLMVDLLEKQAVRWGFAKDEARRIAKATLVGSAELLGASDRSAAEWIGSVASKGGTTEAALGVLAEKGWADIFAGALEAGRVRAGELNRY